MQLQALVEDEFFVAKQCFDGRALLGRDQQMHAPLDFAAVAQLRFEPLTASLMRGQLRLERLHLRLQGADGEFDEHVAWGHLVAVAHEHSFDNAAVDVADRLVPCFHGDAALGDRRAGDRCQHAPSEQPDDQHCHADEAQGDE